MSDVPVLLSASIFFLVLAFAFFPFMILGGSRTVDVATRGGLSAVWIAAMLLILWVLVEALT